MVEINVNTGIKEIEVEAKVFRADGTLKSTEKHKIEIPIEQYNQLKKDGVIK